MKSNKINSIELISKHFVSELKAVFADRGALLILVGAMLIYPVLYSVVYMNETLTDLEIGVVDLDRTDMSRKYTHMLDATSELVVASSPLSLAEAEQQFLANKIKGVVLIENGFQRRVLSGDQAHVAVYADASYFLKYRSTYMAVSYVNATFSGGISVKKYMFEGASFEQGKVAADPLSAQTHILYNPASGYGNFVMPGIILVIIQQTLLIGIGVLGGSFSESKASPFTLPLAQRRAEVLPYLTGKIGAYMLLSFLNVCFGVFCVHHWFNYPDNASFVHILMLLFPYVLAVVALGVGLSTLFRHRESAIVFMVFLSPIALFLSGLSWPASAIPEVLVWVSRLLPSTQVIPAYMRLRTMGVGMSAISHDVLILYLQAGIYVALTLLYFYIHIARDRKKASE